MLLNKESKIIRKLILLSLLMAALTVSNNSQSKTSMPQSLNFSVVSVRLMKEGEGLKRTLHSFNADTVVRLRLSNGSDKGIYFLTYGESLEPLGFTVKQTDKGIVWRTGRGQKSEKSPGVKVAYAGEPKWLLLSPHTAIEWENFDSTLFQNEKHAFTIFTKVEETDEPLEVFSDFYTVPIKEPTKENKKPN